MRTAVLAVLVLAASVIGAANAADAASRIALVIGNSNYASAPLRNPANDARLMAQSLREVGFDVHEHLDVDRRAMRRAFADFGQALYKAGEDVVGLVYYAGHGVQIEGENYLLPVGSQIVDALDVEIEGIRASSLLATLEDAGNRLNIVILDACRNNPFQSTTRSVGAGLARMDAPTGTLLAFSTAPGRVAMDGDGRNSPYTMALARELTTPGAKVEEVFKRVRVRVMERSGGRQVPWEASSLTGDFVFADVVDGQVRVTPTPPPQTRGDEAEIVFWRSIEASDDPGDYQAYLDAFPDGVFSPLARRRLAEASGPEPDEQSASTGEPAAFEALQSSARIADHEDFLEQYPDGRYSAAVRERLDGLRRDQAEDVERAPVVAALQPAPVHEGRYRLQARSMGGEGAGSFMCALGERIDIEVVFENGRMQRSVRSSLGIEHTVYGRMERNGHFEFRWGQGGRSSQLLGRYDGKPVSGRDGSRCEVDFVLTRLD